MTGGDGRERPETVGDGQGRSGTVGDGGMETRLGFVH